MLNSWMISVILFQLKTVFYIYYLNKCATNADVAVQWDDDNKERTATNILTMLVSLWELPFDTKNSMLLFINWNICVVIVAHFSTYGRSKCENSKCFFY